MASSHVFPATTHMLAPPKSSIAVVPNRTPSICSVRASPSANFLSPSVGGSVCGDFSGPKVRPAILDPGTSSPSVPRAKRSVVTRIMPYGSGEDYAPDLASYIYKKRIVYLGLPLAPIITQSLFQQFLFLEQMSSTKPIYFYINSTGTMKGNQKYGGDTEVMVVYDAMRKVKPLVYTLCLSNAWGEASLLLAAGSKGYRFALPSSSIRMSEPVGRFQGQATQVEIARKQIRRVKTALIELYAKHTEKSPEQIEEVMERRKYFSPSEAVEFGIIDKVLHNEKDREVRGVPSAQTTGGLM